ncbi:outer membrane lipoprotein-sorting protein [Pseudarcicella hirudinis]
MKSTVKVMGQEIITVINGETGWSIRPAMMGGTGEAEDLPKDQLKMTRGQMDLGGLLVNYKEKGSTLELAGKEKMDGGDVYKLKLTDKAGEVTNIFVSASTYYILKTAGKRTINGQDIDTEVNYSNFKQVEGLTFPFTMETASPMGGQITIETESIKLNPTIDEAIFQRPAKK